MHKCRMPAGSRSTMAIHDWSTWPYICVSATMKISPKRLGPIRVTELRCYNTLFECDFPHVSAVPRVLLVRRKIFFLYLANAYRDQQGFDVAASRPCAARSIHRRIEQPGRNLTRSGIIGFQSWCLRREAAWVKNSALEAQKYDFRVNTIRSRRKAQFQFGWVVRSCISLA